MIYIKKNGKLIYRKIYIRQIKFNIMDWSLIDITKNEEKIYRAIIDLGSPTIQELAKKTKINQRNVYDYVERLLNKGIIGQVLNNNKRKFVSLNPQLVTWTVEEKTAQLFEKFKELEEVSQNKPQNIDINIITTQIQFLTLIKNNLSHATVYMNKSQIQEKPQFIYAKKNLVKNIVALPFTASSVIAIFDKNLFILYSQDEQAGFFTTNNDFIKNIEVYFHAF